MEIGEKLYAVTNALNPAKVHSNIPHIRCANRIKKVIAVPQRDNSGRLELRDRRIYAQRASLNRTTGDVEIDEH